MRRLSFFLFAAAVLGQDNVLFDNEQARVLKVTDAARQKSGLHQHDVNRVMIYLDAGHMTITEAGGKVNHVRFKAGEALWSPASGKHVSENVTDKPFRIVEVELKGKPRPFEHPALDPVKVDPGRYKVEFENDQARVLRARYGGRETGVLHEHGPDRVIVYLTDATVKVTTPDGNSTTASAKAGDVRWVGVAKHTEENVSEKAFEVVVVELKTRPGEMPKIFGGAQMQEIYRMRLDRDDMLLESILEFIQKNNIQDGAVMTAAGSLQECTFHGVESLAAKPEQKFTTRKGPMEILNVNGVIAAGEPHLHMTLSSPDGPAFGGHLEKGCKVLYRAELTIAKFSGVPLARKPNAQGVPVLQRK